MKLSLEKLRRIAVLLGWAVVLVIAVATLSPIEARPHVPMLGANAERFLSYFAAGAALAFAYPRRRWLVLAGMVIRMGRLTNDTPICRRNVYDIFAANLLT